jgi:predicted TIM-barrel fold metal-dependent hydrolase
MVYSGAFEKHPKLTVMLAEVGVGWLPFLHREIDDRISPTAQLFLGKWSLPLKPSEYLARNVRATPLNGGNDQPLPRIIDELPDDMVLFSSDFPHFEGFTDPAGYFADALAPLSQAKRDRFFGGAAADIFKRMGDPIC